MSCTWKVDIGGGREWSVGSIFSNTTGEVVIPLDQIEGMSDAEIGATVRSLAGQADLGVALVLADFIVMNSGPDFDDPDVFRQADVLERHLGKYRVIDDAWQRFIDVATRDVKRQERADLRYIRSTPRAGFVYVIKAGPHYKIGRTNKLDRRITQLGIQLPWPVEVVFSAEVPNMVWSERELHERFAHKRRNGEWFELSADDLAFIRSHLS